MLESKNVSWLAASPHVIVAMTSTTGEPLSTKTQTDRVAKNYHPNVIFCNFDGGIWKECVEEDHSNQIMVQLVVTGLNKCCYIIAKAGTTGGKWYTYLYGMWDYY